MHPPKQAERPGAKGCGQVPLTGPWYECARHHRPYRPETEGAIALAQHEFGLDVIALAGVLHHRDHRSVPEIHKTLRERSVANLLDRYDELLATSLSDSGRLRALLASQGRVIAVFHGSVVWTH